MLPLHVTLSYYKKKDVQEEIVDSAKDKEVSARYNDNFGRRPDVLNHPGDILEFAKQGATSFHASEELWNNPLQLHTEMKRKEQNDLRKGWDFVLDIDCPYWNLSKIITWLFVRALKLHGITSISIKFSGNKGFHIGVPFEAFPSELDGKNVKDLFPELPKAIATYLLDYISNKEVEVTSDNVIVFGGEHKISFKELKDLTSKSINEITVRLCSECNRKINDEIKKEVEFVCQKCGASVKDNESSFRKCEKCNVLMEKIESKKNLCKCGSNNFYRKFNPLSIIEVDTLLISSRHLYRMPYSLHEKSGLYSRPFNPDKVMNFEKKYADPANVKISKWKFLDRERVVNGEMEGLCKKSLEFSLKPTETEDEIKREVNFEDIGEVPETCFPPCVKNIFNGIVDGRKRSLFALTNFLSCVGWSYDKIEEYLLKWNENNPEPLREVNIKGQVRYHKQNKKKVMPPNCSNKMYYVEIGVCKPDNLCSKVKNPVNYAIRKGRYLNKDIRKQKDKKNQKQT